MPLSNMPYANAAALEQQLRGGLGNPGASASAAHATARATTGGNMATSAHLDAILQLATSNALRPSSSSSHGRNSLLLAALGAQNTSRNNGIDARSSDEDGNDGRVSSSPFPNQAAAANNIVDNANSSSSSLNTAVVTTANTSKLAALLRTEEQKRKQSKQDEKDEPYVNGKLSTTYRDFSHILPTESQGGTAATATSSTKEPTFPVKLHMILSNLEYQDIIAWLPHGRSWRILQQKAFEERVIPLYFRHGRYSSFARQVNGWGFRRITHGTDYNSYYHELFLRGMPHLCDRMRRLTTKDMSKRKKAEEEPAPDFYEFSRDRPLPENSAAGLMAAAAVAASVPDGPGIEADRNLTLNNASNNHSLPAEGAVSGMATMLLMGNNSNAASGAGNRNGAAAVSMMGNSMNMATDMNMGMGMNLFMNGNSNGNRHHQHDRHHLPAAAALAQQQRQAAAAAAMMPSPLSALTSGLPRFSAAAKSFPQVELAMLERRKAELLSRLASSSFMNPVGGGGAGGMAPSPFGTFKTSQLSARTSPLPGAGAAAGGSSSSSSSLTSMLAAMQQQQQQRQHAQNSMQQKQQSMFAMQQQILKNQLMNQHHSNHHHHQSNAAATTTDHFAQLIALKQRAAAAAAGNASSAGASSAPSGFGM